MKILWAKRVLIAMAVALSLCSTAIPLLAQATTGAAAQISGTVSDPTGAVVPGAQVKATQTNTGFVRTAVTGSDGTYVLANLLIGPYELVVTGKGFKTYSQKGIVLQVNNNVTINVALQLGEVSQTVNVSANASMVQMTSSSVSQVIDRERVEELPLNGRDPTQLIFLSGAAVLSTYGDFSSSKDYPTSHATSVAGGQANGTSYFLDGGTDMDPFAGTNLPLPFPDALQEFSVQTSTIPAQFGGQAAGVINVVTKSGTNRVHGDLFEFVRNGAVNARNFFAASSDTLKRNQFGGTIGGPIKKDKLFYFGGFQGTRTRTAPPTSTSFVPTAAALQGNFSTLDSPTCGKSATFTLKNPAGGTFAGNMMSPTLFNSSATQMIQKYVPTSGDPCGKLLIGIPNPSGEDQYIGRMDWIASSRNSLFGRYFNSDYRNPAEFGGDLLMTTRAGVMDMVQSMTVGDTYAFGPSLVNSVRMTWDRDRINRGPAANLPSAASIGLNIAPSPGNFPNISISGYFSTLCGTCARARNHSNVAEVADDVSWLHGRNQIGLGADYARRDLNYLFTTLTATTYSFDGSFTGDGLADFLLGVPVSFHQGNDEPYFGRQNLLGLYAQDSFRLSSRLTLLAGLRWEPYFPTTDEYDRAMHFDPGAFSTGQTSKIYPKAPPGILFPGDTLSGFGTIPSAGTSIHLPDFEPRVGFAWDPTGSGRWSVRAAYGIFYDLPGEDRFDRYGINSPWGSTLVLTSPSGGFSNPYASYPGGDPFPGATFPLSGSYMNLPLNVRVPRTQQWNLLIQRQMGGNWLFSAEYIGNGSIHRWINTEENPAVYVPGTCGTTACSTTGNTQARRVLSLENPTAYAAGQGGALISTITFDDDGANAEYNGLLLKADHRISQGFSVLANYTYSHCLSEAQEESEFYGNDYQNPYNRNADRGNCVNDFRQIFHLSYLATTPHFKGPITNKLLGNWEHSGIVGRQTGAWLTPTVGQDVSLTGVNVDRPNLVGNAQLSNPTLQEWFNTAAYAKQATGTFGNAGRYSLLGPGAFTFDAMLTRSFKFREGQKLEVRFEAFNWLNHATFANPGTTLTTTSSFGKILSANDPRILQFAMKYIF